MTEVSAGMQERGVNWALDISEEDWRSKEWQSLVSSARRFVDAFRENELFKPRSDTTVASDGPHLLYLMRWMLRYKYASFSALDRTACRYFVQDTAADKISTDENQTNIKSTTLASYFRVVELLFKYSVLFDDFPEMKVPEHPFGGISPESVAQEFVALNRGRIAAAPIEIFNPVIRCALTWLDDFTPHILALQYAFLEGVRDLGDANTKNSIWYTNRRIREVLPRHADALRPALRAESRFAFFSDSRIGLTPILRDLVNDHTGGLTLILESEVGIRGTELAGLRALPYDSAGNPYCVVIRPSTTGLYEHFFLRGFMYKGKDKKEPIEVEWLAGSRPAGSNWIPDPIRAVIVLEELYRPWRTMAHSDALMVSLGTNHAMPMTRPKRSRVLLSTIVDYQNMFIQHHVQLDGEFHGRRVTGREWRKRYAENIIEIDEALVPEVQQQLKHVSDAITEEAYIGNDPYLKSMVDDQIAVTTGRTMFDLIFGDEPVTGKIVDDLADDLPKIRDWCEQFTGEGQSLDALTELLRQDGIRLWGSAYGNCIFRPEKSRCHHVENGEFDFKATRPLETHRCPDLCAGCSNLMITKRHAGFWRERYESNMQIFHEATNAGLTTAATVARERARVAKLILHRLKIRPESDEEESNG